MSKQLTGRVTIHDVAKRASVSASTVSLVLNGQLHRMRPETSARVMQAVTDLGYATNQMARALKTGFVPTIGLVVPTVANPFGEFARCVEHAAMARDYHVLLCNAERIAEREQLYVESMLSRGITGVILGSSPLLLDHLKRVISRGLKVVAYDRLHAGGEDLELDSVRVDNRLGASLALQHLLELGHRRIGFVSGYISSASRRDRLTGYQESLAAVGIPEDPSLIWMENADPGELEEEATEIGRIAALAMLARPRPPTAFFAINDMTAVGIIAGVRDAGLRIPHDVSVVGFDDIHLSKNMSPPITTIRQPLEELMNSAVDVLIKRMVGKTKEPPVHITLAPELIVRGSTAKCTKG